MISYHVIITGQWCRVVLIKVHAPTEDMEDMVKDVFCIKLENLFDYLQKCDMKIMMGDVDRKIMEEETLHQQYIVYL